MEAQRKQLAQFVILTVLLAVLGFMGWRMWNQFNPAPPAATGPATTSAAATPARPGSPAPAPAKGTPTPAAGAPAAPEAASLTFPMLAGGKVNADLFRVYALQPPKNPFVQKEEWYKEQLAQVPGYPYLRDEEFFETMEPVFPDISQTFGADKEWSSISLRRDTGSQINVEGASKDGKIRTSLQLTEAVPENVELTWTPESGIPLDSLDNAGYVRDNLDKLSPRAGAVDGGGLAVPEAGQMPGGLAIPGGTAPDATSAALSNGQAPGDTLACVGVNFKGEKATALMYYNGSPYLVMAGSVLPTHYQVMEIKEDGVVLLELRDGSTKWVPLIMDVSSIASRRSTSTQSSSPQISTSKPMTQDVRLSKDADYEREKQSDPSLEDTYRYNVEIDCKGDPNSGIWWYDLYLYSYAGEVIGHIQGEVDFSKGANQTARVRVETTVIATDSKVIWGKGTQRVRID